MHGLLALALAVAVTASAGGSLFAAADFNAAKVAFTEALRVDPKDAVAGLGLARLEFIRKPPWRRLNAARGPSST